ncbi:MAG: pilus assembly protein [Thalassovita sp.]|nr:pilus assembly protein [Thalassovita sp.]
MIATITNRLRQFLADEDGAITVDWVVLTAAVVGLAFAATIPVFTGTKSVSNSLNDSLQIAMEDAGETD